MFINKINFKDCGDCSTGQSRLIYEKNTLLSNQTIKNMLILILITKTCMSLIPPLEEMVVRQVF